MNHWSVQTGEWERWSSWLKGRDGQVRGAKPKVLWKFCPLQKLILFKISENQESEGEGESEKFEENQAENQKQEVEVTNDKNNENRVRPGRKVAMEGRKKRRLRKQYSWHFKHVVLFSFGGKCAENTSLLFCCITLRSVWLNVWLNHVIFVLWLVWCVCYLGQGNQRVVPRLCMPSQWGQDSITKWNIHWNQASIMQLLNCLEFLCVCIRNTRTF